MNGRAGSAPRADDAGVSIVDLSDAGAAAALRRADRVAGVAGVVLIGATSTRRRLRLEDWSGKPVVQVLSGRLDAVTLGLACHADARVATEDTVLDPDLLTDPAVFAAVAELVGAARVPELLVGAELTAHRLREVGLATEVVPAEAVHARAEQLIHRLAGLGRDALAVLRNRPATARPDDEPAGEPAPAGEIEQPDLRVVPGSRSGPQTRQKILDAAAYVLRTRGYTACRLADIAKLVGTHQTSVYHYFPSKEALVDEVLRVGVTGTFHPVRDTVEGLPAGATALDRLAVAVRAHLRVVLTSGDYATAAMTVTGELPKESLERIRGIQHEYGQYWARLFSEASAAGYLRPGMDLSVIRSFIAGALNYAIEWYDPAKGGVDELADQFLPVILEGLAVPDRIAGADLTAIGRAPHPVPEQPTDAENPDDH